jgi:predicted nucleic acid-binding protein
MITLVDTSIWVDHLRQRSDRLTALLVHDQVRCHPLIIGELACGNLRNRRAILDLLTALPISVIAEHEEVLSFIESHRLFGHGLGWIDANLLVSAILDRCRLLTHATALKRAAAMFNIA